MKNLLIILALIFPVNVYSDYFNSYTFIECDKKINYLTITNKVIRGEASSDLDKKDSRYKSEYKPFQEGKCDIGKYTITWKLRYNRVSIIVDGKLWIDRMAIRDNKHYVLIRINYYDNNVNYYENDLEMDVEQIMTHSVVWVSTEDSDFYESKKLPVTNSSKRDPDKFRYVED